MRSDRVVNDLKGMLAQLSTHCQQLAAAICDNRDQLPVDDGLALLAALPPEAIVRATAAVRVHGALQTFWSEPTYASRSWLSAHQTARARHLAALARMPDLAQLFVMHGDGYVREAALAALINPPATPFAICALVYALNDSVTEVRSAAAQAASRLLPVASSEVVAAAAGFLLQQRRRLTRWGLREPAIVSQTLLRADVAEAMRLRLMQNCEKRPIVLLQEAMRTPALDHALVEIATHATLGSVRAVALAAVLRRAARHRSGYTREWIDKRYGLERRVPAFEERPIHIVVDDEKLLLTASADRAAVVRKVVASRIIELTPSVTPDLDAVMLRYATDSSRGVREKAAWFLKQRRV